MKVFLASTSLHTAYGGPAYSVARLAAALSHEGHEVGLWSADGSTPAFNVDCRMLRGTIADALQQFGSPRVIHDNGLWLRHNHSIALLAREKGIARVVSPRGMLEPWALDHKRLKKRIAWQLYQRRDVSRASSIHATSAVEAANIVRMNLGTSVTVIPNGVDLPDHVRGDSSRSDLDSVTPLHRKAVFIGRIHPVKGLPMLVEAWSRVRPAGWTLQIAGPDEAGHRRVVENEVAKAGLTDLISLTGPVRGESKDQLLREAHLFVLPTHSESFGMAVAEALAYGVPVLTTTAAPWPMLEEQKCGWLSKPTADGIVESLKIATSLEPSALEAMGQRGRAFVASELTWSKVAREFTDLYERATST